MSTGDKRRGRVKVSEASPTRQGPLEEPGEEARWRMGLEPAPHPDPSKGCIRRGLCCKTNPGWFGPGEVEQAAAVLGLDPDDFIRSALVIDTHETPEGPVHVFAPVKLGRDGQPVRRPATAVDTLYRMFPGTCIFFEGGGCRIYEARPIECRSYLCTRPAEENLSHEAIAALWKAGP